MASNRGTSVKAYEIFQDVPVRRNYAKKRQIQELKKVERLVWSYGLVHPELRISLVHDQNQLVLKTSCKSSLIGLQQVLGMEICSRLEHHCLSLDNLSAHLILPKVGDDKCLKSSSEQLFLFLNSRPVKSKSLEKLIKNAYLDKFPCGLLHLQLPPEQIDVNVEADKTKVFIENEDKILDFVLQQLKSVYEIVQVHPGGDKRAQVQKNVVVEESSLEKSSDESILESSLNKDLNHDVSLGSSMSKWQEKRMANLELNNSSEASWSKGNLFKTIQPVSVFTGKDPIVENPQFNKRPMRDDFAPAKKKQSLITSFSEDFNSKDILEDSAKKKRKLNSSFSSEDKKLRKAPEKTEPSLDSYLVHEPIETHAVTRKPEKRRKILEVKMSPEKVLDFHADPGESAVSDVIGQLKPSGFWVVQLAHPQELVIVNHQRVQEVIMFKRLLQTHNLGGCPMPKQPIDLYSEPRWNPLLNQTLESLFKKDSIEDKRFENNGIAIRKINSAPHLTHVSPKVPFMGCSDVMEILQVIQDNPEAGLEDCRPLKVIAYLKSEARRISSQIPPNVDKDEVRSLVQVINEGKMDVCIHSRPLFWSLASTSD